MKAKLSVDELVDQLPFAMILVDRDGVVLRQNRMLPMLAPNLIRDRNIRQMDCTNMFHPDGCRYEAADLPVMRALDHGEQVPSECIRYHARWGIALDRGERFSTS